MNKKRLILLMLVLVLASGCARAPLRKVASELVLKEKDFTYSEYNEGIAFIEKSLDDYYNNEIDKKRDWEIENLGIPNNLLRLKGYGLFAQRDIIRLKLENARFKGVDKKEIVNLEKELQRIEKQIRAFLSENIWHD